MRNILGVSVAMLIWGSQALASLPSPGAEAGDLKKVSDWAAHLNHYYPALDVEVVVDLRVDKNVKAALRDLHLLEEQMQGTVQLQPAALKTVECKHIICHHD